MRERKNESHYQDTPDMLKVKVTITDLSKRYNLSVRQNGHLDSRTVAIKFPLAEAHYELAEFELQQGHYLAAVRHYHFSSQLSEHCRSTNKLYKEKNQQTQSFSSPGNLLKESFEVSDVSEKSEVIFLQGLCYLSGIGVPPNDQTAFTLFQQAAELENAAAQTNLAYMYDHDRVADVSKEEAATQAVLWYKKAAEHGNATAQNNLAWLYRQGRVAGPLSQKEADELAALLFQKAAEQGDAIAQCQLGGMYWQGRVAGLLSQEEADKLAVLWCQRSAEQGNAVAQVDLGWLYRQGRVDGVSEEEADELAVLLFQKAAEQGDEMAQRLLEIMATSTDASRNKGKLLAEYALFHLHMDVKHNEQEAMKWFNLHPRAHGDSYARELVMQAVDCENLTVVRRLFKTLANIDVNHINRANFITLAFKEYKVASPDDWQWLLGIIDQRMGYNIRFSENGKKFIAELRERRDTLQGLFEDQTKEPSRSSSALSSSALFLHRGNDEGIEIGPINGKRYCAG